MRDPTPAAAPAIPLDVTGLPLLGSGREADVYALDERRVLRRYRRGGDTAHEAMTMAYLAAQRYPVPAVYRAAGPDLVLERLSGRTMTQEWLAGALDLPSAAQLLARLHRQLHAVPPRGAGRPDDRILHLDLHPDNVLITGRGPVVIDWRNTAEGPPDYDLAITALILAELVVGTDPALHEPARTLLAHFLAAAGGTPAALLDRAVGKRTDDLSVDAAGLAMLNRAAGVVAALAG